MLSKIYAFFLALTLLLIPIIPARALELSVTGNGDASSNEVAVTQENTTQVNQTNEASVQNDVNVEADTGNNTVNDSAGETTIETGDINVATTVTNTVNNAVVNVESECCTNTDSSVNITGNGNGSDNTATLTLISSTFVNINQTATIVNNITGAAVTGQNHVSGSGGDVSIITGDIKGNINVSNQVNLAFIRVETGCCGEDSVRIKIANNGVDSTNTVDFTDSQTIVVDKADESFITNNIGFDFVTGENTVENSLGDVYIKTGDIDFEVGVNNVANLEIVEVECCDDEPVNPPEPPVNPPPVVPPPQVNPDDGDGDDKDGDDDDDDSDGVGGAVLGLMLPATGSRDFLYMMIANIFMLLFGCYLRRLSGRAPATA